MRNATILIVEDDAILAMNLQRMVSLMGYTVSGPLASGEHACKFEAQLKAEIEDLLHQAEEADRPEVPDGMDIPDELARREERLTAIAKAKAEIEKRATARHATEQAEYEQKLAERKPKNRRPTRNPVASSPNHLCPAPRTKTKST